MAKTFSRSDRIAEQIQRELADLLQFEVKDPRVGMVTVTEVEVSGDMAHAKIFYSAKQGTAAIQQGLEKAAGYLRTQLAKRLLLRTVPQLHFVYDVSIDRGTHLSRLIDDAIANDQPANKPGDAN
ncbi:30S ribosome-binding factor RbfA [Pseudomethylobacillus aquaticus]|uniref:Ribosome-binding factor A n=1 Tax=Pseudomethylobacillus aquaticus TaxID=2676064 RepID=A0A3N0UYT6_9PROT|nr:30S ribosome-binding factor RbfA [Pseudomethylobacillus aquaticus]ROH85690.1 30S ribosome-binding factor RbfA [Pseudomethylobacillus aquaticus]